MEALQFTDYTLVRRLGVTLFGDTALYRHQMSGELTVVKQSCKTKLLNRNTLTCEDPITEIEMHRALACYSMRADDKTKSLQLDPVHEAVKTEPKDDVWHPNILPLLEWGESAASLWTVTPYCAAGDLFGLMDLHRTGLSPSAARNYFQQMAQGVGFLHTNGFCHLDLSLENMYITANGVLKIADFGQCRASQFLNVSPGSALPGKRFYRAPEYYEARKTAQEQGYAQATDGMAADVYSLGVILFIMLSGSPPFECSNDDDPRWRWLQKRDFQQFVTQIGCTKAFDDNVVRLLSQMLCLKSRRLHIHEVLTHPYLVIS